MCTKDIHYVLCWILDSWITSPTCRVEVLVGGWTLQPGSVSFTSLS